MSTPHPDLPTPPDPTRTPAQQEATPPASGPGGSQTPATQSFAAYSNPEAVDVLKSAQAKDPDYQYESLKVTMRKKLEQWRLQLVEKEKSFEDRLNLWESVRARCNDLLGATITDSERMWDCWGRALDFIHYLNQPLVAPLPSRKLLDPRPPQQKIEPVPEPLLFLCFIIAIDEAPQKAMVTWEPLHAPSLALKIHTPLWSEFTSLREFLQRERIQVEGDENTTVFLF